MNTEHYPPPIDKLLTYGVANIADGPDWPNYLELGIGPEHIPDLIRMAVDTDLHKADLETPEAWAPVHAWRALGQLHSETAVHALLAIAPQLLTGDMIWEWALEELPEVFSESGPAAIPALAAYLADTSHDETTRSTIIEGLQKLATRQPESRADCIAVLTHQLEVFDKDDQETNGSLVAALSHLKALEALPIIKRAYELECVDEGFIDLEDVEVDLGLKTRPEPEFTNLQDLLRESMAQRPPAIKVTPDMITIVPPTDYKPVSSSKAPKTKNKRKLAKLARKKNRKK